MYKTSEYRVLHNPRRDPRPRTEFAPTISRSANIAVISASCAKASICTWWSRKCPMFIDLHMEGRRSSLNLLAGSGDQPRLQGQENPTAGTFDQFWQFGRPSGP